MVSIPSLETWRDQVSNMPDSNLAAAHENAKKHGQDYVNIVVEARDKRTPQWRHKRKSFGKPVPTRAVYKGDVRNFPTQWQAYIFLIDCLTSEYNDVLERPGWQAAFMMQAKAGWRIAKHQSDLFQKSPHLLVDDANYTFVNGWYINLVVSKTQKIDTLLKLCVGINGAVNANLQWGVDVFFEPKITHAEIVPISDLSSLLK